MTWLTFLIAVLLVAGPAAANEKNSVYTSLDLDACRQEPLNADDPVDGGTWWCDGYEGMPVRVSEGDLRFFVSYGEAAAGEIAATQTLPAFNTINKTLEWRLELGRDDGRWHAFATILRFFTDAGEGAARAQFLVITKLGGPGQICHIGTVNALLNPDANVLARRVADEAASGYVCGVDGPLEFGLVGDDAQE